MAVLSRVKAFNMFWRNNMFNWFFNLFKNNSDAEEYGIDSDIGIEDDMDTVINPANGMPMIGGSGGIDIEGNPYGTDDSFNGIDDPFDDGFMDSSDPFSGDMFDNDSFSDDMFSDDSF